MLSSSAGSAGRMCGDGNPVERNIWNISVMATLSDLLQLLSCVLYITVCESGKDRVMEVYLRIYG